jgi:hypothetical protein
VGQAGAGGTGDRSEEGHAQAARSVASHPEPPTPILAGSPPRTAGNDTHKSVDCYAYVCGQGIFWLACRDGYHWLASSSLVLQRCEAQIRPTLIPVVNDCGDLSDA